MGVIMGQMRKRRGARGAGYSKGDLIINISVDVKMGKLCLPPGPPAGLMVSTNFPRAAVWVFLWIQRGEHYEALLHILM